MRRRAIRVGKERREKRIREAVKESRRLQRARFDAPIVELEKPYQRGWIRILRLTDRAKRRPDAELLEELLLYVDCVQLCRKGRFEEWSSNLHRWVPRKHRPRRLTVCQFLKPRTPSKLYRYFRFTSGIRVVNRELLDEFSRKRRGARLEVNCEHFFELQVLPYYITHQRVDLPEVKSQQAWLDDWLEQCQGWFQWDRMNGHRVSRWWRYSFLERQRRLRKIAEAEMREERLKFNDRRQRARLTQGEMKKGTTNVVPFAFGVRAAAFEVGTLKSLRSKSVAA